MPIKNLKKAAQRIKKAIKSKERIILYSDADVDGVTSVVILKETLDNLSANVASIYIPDRETEGYGINDNALDKLKKLAPALFISLDLGIANFKEITRANDIGFEVIVIDHHEILDKIPNASIVVDPKQPGDKSPFKLYANVGIVFKLSKLLLGEKMSKSLENSFLELTALGTVADMMPERGENKTFIKKGLQSLENTFRPALRAFFETPLKKTYQLGGIRTMADKINSVLNAGKSQGDIHQTYLALTASSVKESKDIIADLFLQRKQKRNQVSEMVLEIKKSIAHRQDELIIFEGNPFWPLVCAGVAATVVYKDYKKPTFIYKEGPEKSQGAVRAPKDVNSVAAMNDCSQYLITYGGHPQASGFTLKNKNLEKFKKCLIEYFNKNK